jgi:hypothetical protein
MSSYSLISLIDQLADDLKPVRPRRISRDMTIIASICLAEIVMFFALGAALPVMPMRMHQPTFWWRLLSLGLIAVISFVPAVLSFSPTHSPRRALRRICGVIVVCLLAGLWFNEGGDELANLIRRIDWRDGIQCAAEMIALSIPPVTGLGMLMHRGAPADQARSALLVGIAGAAWGAFVFVFACPFNDPLYIAVWYSVGCGTVTLLSRALLPRLARW